MGLIQNFLNILKTQKAKLPENLDTIDEIKVKTKDVLKKNSSTIDQVTNKIPGEVDDKIIEKVRQVTK